MQKAARTVNAVAPWIHRRGQLSRIVAHAKHYTTQGAGKDAWLSKFPFQKERQELPEGSDEKPLNAHKQSPGHLSVIEMNKLAWERRKNMIEHEPKEAVPETQVKTPPTVSETTKTLHLFRALLREASYLPDPASRKFFHHHIRSRFRDYCPRKPKSHPYTTNGEPVKPTLKIHTTLKAAQARKRTTQVLASARKDLHFLTRANAGARTPLTKVLEMTYGRRGKRKHTLLLDLMPPRQLPPNDIELRRLSEALDAPPSKETASTPNMSLFSDKFVALVKSQMKQREDNFNKPLPRSTAPKIPETNTWGRPLPIVRVKNLTKKWYAQTLDRLMAPLLEAEWMHLRDLAIGKVQWSGQPERRAKGTGDWEAGGAFRAESSLQPVGQRENVERMRARQAHDLTPRYMRRMWAEVFAQCPLMMWVRREEVGGGDGIKGRRFEDAVKGKGDGRWRVQWGKVDEGKRVVLSMDNRYSDIGEAFEGVDENGRLLKVITVSQIERKGKDLQPSKGYGIDL